MVVNRDITKNIKVLVRRMEEVGRGNISIDYKQQKKEDETASSAEFCQDDKSWNSLIVSIKYSSDITVDASMYQPKSKDIKIIEKPKRV